MMDPAHPFILTDPDAFAARVVGDSMLPEYREGDVIVFSPAAPPTDGCCAYVVTLPGRDPLFRRVRFIDAGDAAYVKLEPLNPEHEALTIPANRIEAIYAMAYMMREA